MLRVPYSELYEEFLRVLLKLGFAPERARRCAQLFAETSRDGVYSHGLNRFPRFVFMIQNGRIDIHAEPALVASLGALERWGGNIGPGNLNAYACMERAITLSQHHGMGCVALANTNHWMRGGSYGWQAADAGSIGICWTNTLPNVPPWGASDARVGNNPLVIAVPRVSGHIVLDTAMSQFSYGTMASYRRRNELLPVEGGFDAAGKLTRDAAAIEESRRPLPIGYWKGSGLALMLDLLASILSGGLATHQLSTDPDRESSLSQVFIAFDARSINGTANTSRIADEILEHFRFSRVVGGEPVRYPGERVLKDRAENLDKGVPVDPAVWAKVRAM